MCSPENSIPRDVLLAKLLENEIHRISNKELFFKNSDTLTKSGELDELQLSKSEMQLLSVWFRKYFFQRIFCEKNIFFVFHNFKP